MTLINYLTRIHFADGVLEEALRSEMERMKKRRPLIVADPEHIEGGIGERLYSSFPIRTRTRTFSEVPQFVTETAADAAADVYRRERCDLIIAFGGNSAIDLAKVARATIGMNEPVSQLVSEEGGMHGIGSEMPEMIAIPDVSGFSSAVSDYSWLKLEESKQALLRARQMIPTVAICDPTVTLGSSDKAAASSAAGVISRSIDSYLAKGFNPPADGLALDSLNRVVNNAEAALKHDELPARREMMAGCLNSALSMQKGLCAVHAITHALAAVADEEFDLDAAGRLVLPHLVRAYGDTVSTRSDELKRSLRIDEDVELHSGLSDMLRPLPLPDSLSGMGVAKHRLNEAAKQASSDRAIRNGPRAIRKSDILSILETVY